MVDSENPPKRKPDLLAPDERPSSKYSHSSVGSHTILELLRKLEKHHRSIAQILLPYSSLLENASLAKSRQSLELIGELTDTLALFTKRDRLFEGKALDKLCEDAAELTCNIDEYLSSLQRQNTLNKLCSLRKNKKALECLHERLAKLYTELDYFMKFKPLESKNSKKNKKRLIYQDDRGEVDLTSVLLQHAEHKAMKQRNGNLSQEGGLTSIQEFSDGAVIFPPPHGDASPLSGNKSFVYPGARTRSSLRSDLELAGGRSSVWTRKAHYDDPLPHFPNNIGGITTEQKEQILLMQQSQGSFFPIYPPEASNSLNLLVTRTKEAATTTPNNAVVANPVANLIDEKRVPRGMEQDMIWNWLKRLDYDISVIDFPPIEDVSEEFVLNTRSKESFDATVSPPPSSRGIASAAVIKVGS